MTRITPDNLPIGADATLRLDGVKVYDPTTHAMILATGITLAARIALTPTGAAIDASLAVACTESGVAGNWYAIFQGSDTNTHLRAHLGKLVYCVVTSGSDYVGHFPLRVLDGVPLGA